MPTHSTAPSPARQHAVSDGCVVAVRGAVVDVRFADDQLPAIDDALLILSDDLPPVLAEVQAHLSETTVRALALQSTTGLRRGSRVQACGGPIRGTPRADRAPFDSLCSAAARRADQRH
ncbi:F0F1-type ATP synthase beta subunit [Paraburkholderia bryophila]|uniref:F0F1-type ATP synthase beta subunit n=1 Tax=Paraburkholderia bryophila TaxID=420952 RepID=A0A7Y9W580_9BURK|nr:F0F1-type ATP synthase beta subunit [Paraburkholderia bryophila]